MTLRRVCAQSGNQSPLYIGVRLQNDVCYLLVKSAAQPQTANFNFNMIYCADIYTNNICNQC